MAELGGQWVRLRLRTGFSGPRKAAKARVANPGSSLEAYAQGPFGCGKGRHQEGFGDLASESWHAGDCSGVRECG